MTLSNAFAPASPNLIHRRPLPRRNPARRRNPQPPRREKACALKLPRRTRTVSAFASNVAITRSFLVLRIGAGGRE